MKLRLASVLLALSMPMMAQEPAASPAIENTFYKAYWLERGARDAAGAMALYEEFLNKAPEHALAKHAAAQQYQLLVRAGKEKEAAEFAKKYVKLLGENPTADAGRGEGRPGGAGRTGEGGAGRGEGGAGREGGGAGGRAGGRGMQPVKFAEMTAEQLAEFKTQRLERMSGQVARLRDAGNEDGAKQLETNLANLKKAIEEKKLDEAQKIYDGMMASMRRGRGGD